jgi:hypothetical protein
MIDALIFVSQRPVVITLAIFGALLVMAGSLTQKRTGDQSGAARRSTDNRVRPLSRRLTTFGYAITAASVLLFIIAGFVSDLRP